MAALIAPVGVIVGCSGADNPKLAAAPTFVPPTNPEPPKIPGRRQPHFANPKYLQFMEKQAQQQR